MIEAPPDHWRTLQNRVAAILTECGLQCSIEKDVTLARGSSVIDVYAIDFAADPPIIYFCECKHWASRVPRAEVQAFRAIVQDGGAHVGLFISSIGFQEGAQEVVRHTNVQLDSWHEFQEVFVERWCRQYWIPRFREAGGPLANATEPLVSDCWTRADRGEPLEVWEAVGLLASEMWSPTFTPLDVPPAPNPLWLATAIFALRDQYARYLPADISATDSLRQLHEGLLAVCEHWVRANK
jgi:hypothetical protein